MIASSRAFKIFYPRALLEVPAHDCETLALRHGRHLMKNVRAERDEHSRLAPQGYPYVLATWVFQKTVEGERAALVFALDAARCFVAEEDDGRDAPLPYVFGRAPALRIVAVRLEEVSGLID